VVACRTQLPGDLPAVPSATLQEQPPEADHVLRPQLQIRGSRVEALRIDRPGEAGALVLAQVRLVGNRLAGRGGGYSERVEQVSPRVGQYGLAGCLDQDRRQQVHAVVGVMELLARRTVLALEDVAHPVRRTD
jgi:hypothetical protein